MFAKLKGPEAEMHERATGVGWGSGHTGGVEGNLGGFKGKWRGEGGQKRGFIPLSHIDSRSRSTLVRERQNFAGNVQRHFISAFCILTSYTHSPDVPTFFDNPL